jgi:hypothetical protein
MKTAKEFKMASTQVTIAPRGKSWHGDRLQNDDLGSLVKMTELTAQAVFDLAFKPGREPRSDAYRQGVLHCLQVRVDGLAFAPCPYALGSSDSDAYHAGIAEGRALSPVS